MKTVIKKKRRRWFQFRLRTLLIVMLVTGLALAYFRPRPQPTWTLADDWKVFAHIKQIMGPNVPVELRFGSYSVRDRAGRRRVVGRYQSSQADGTWTIYHDNGRRAMSGECREGIPVGRWRAWYLDGRPAVDVAFGDVDELLTQAGVVKSKYSLPQPHREGTASFFHQETEQETAAQFTHDQADGDWRADDDQHAITYRQGLRHDDLATNSAGPRYLLGHQVSDPQQVLRTIEADLNSDDRSRQLAAIAMLRVLAIGKVDDAKIFTALDRLSTAPDDELAIAAVLVGYRLGQSRDTALRELLQRGIAAEQGQRLTIARCFTAAEGSALTCLERELSASLAANRQYAFQILVAALYDAKNSGQPDGLGRFRALIEIITRTQSNPDPSLRNAAIEVLKLCHDGQFPA